MKTVSVLALAGSAALFAACSEPAETPLETSANFQSGQATVARVTTNANAGPGSFRQALIDANGNTQIVAIRFEGDVGTIKLQTPVTYTGSQALVINARGSKLDGAALGADEAALVANGGGDLTLRDLAIMNAPGNGATIAVPANATGTFTVELDDVIVKNNAGHGILINDQAEYFIDPNSTSQAGSDAEVVVRVTESRFEGNGSAALDRDGLRINEGGAGDLEVVVRDTRFVGNGADGLELDERAAGNAVFTMHRVAFNENGFFSSEDYDDGIDVDESGDGDVIGRFANVSANGNAEQGIDLNENDAGDLRIEMRQVEALRNGEEGIEFEEDDDFAGGGDIVAELREITTRENGANDGDAGLKLREKGDGNMFANIVDAVSTNNAIAGILVREDAAGDLTARLVNAKAMHNGNDGIVFDENGAGNLDGRLVQPTSSHNTGAGISLEQATTGTGAVLINELTAVGNTETPVAVSGDVVVTQRR